MKLYHIQAIKEGRWRTHGRVDLKILHHLMLMIGEVNMNKGRILLGSLLCLLEWFKVRAGTCTNHIFAPESLECRVWMDYVSLDIYIEVKQVGANKVKYIDYHVLTLRYDHKRDMIVTWWSSDYNR